MGSLVRRCLVLAVGLVLVAAAASPTVAAAATVRLCSGYSGCAAAGYGDAGYAAASGTSYWGMYPGHNCTNYAAYRLIRNGVDASYLRGQGNAYQWGGVAQAHGVAVNGTPAVGAIAWWASNAGGVGADGHVAYVEQVGNGSVLLSEDNYGGDFHWVNLTAGTAPSGYIHFGDVPVNPPPPSDRDGDGTPDSSDRCPDVAGPAANNGCPWPYSNQLLHNGSFESGFGGWGGLNQAGSVNFASYTNVDRAHDGTGFGEMNTSVGGASAGQDISASVAAGDSYSFSIWLRAAPGVGSFTGNLRLWGLGISANEGSDSPFTVGEQWTLVTVPLDTNGNHSQLRAEIYLYSSGNLDADTAQVVRVGLRSASFEPGAPGGWMPLNEAGSVNFAGYTDASRAHDGSGFGEMNSSGTNGSVGQDIAATVLPGDSYAFSVWLRAAPGTATYSGNLKLWGLGQTANEGFGTPFTVGDRWTLVTAPLDAKGNHDHLRAEIYMNSAGNLDVDGAAVVKTGLNSASFESGFGGWHQQSQPDSVNLASYTDPARAHDGSGFGEMNSAVDGGSVGQDVNVAVAAGDSYAFSVWLRAAPGTETFSGVVHLWGLGLSANEGSDTHFTVGQQWTLVTAPLDAQAPHNQLRAEIYMNSGGNLDADGATLVVGGARTDAAALQVAEPVVPPATVGTAWSTTLAATGGTAPYTWSVQSGALPAGVVLGAGGTISGTPTAAGTATATIAVTDMSVPPATVTRPVTIDVGDPLRVAVAALPTGVLATPYSTTLTALGATGATSWSVASGALPSGLRLTRAGVLSGKPTAAGAFRFVVKVTDSAVPVQSATKAFTVKIAGVAVATSSLPSGAVGKPVSSQLTAQGGVGTRTWTVSSGALPGGVTLSADGRLTGSPTAAGTFRFVATVTDSASPPNTASRSLQLVVAPVAVRTASLKVGTVGKAYSQTLLAWGGTAPLTWKVAAGGLPAGLTLGTTGVLSGKPTTAGTYSFTARVTDAQRKTATAVLTVVVS